MGGKRFHLTLWILLTEFALLTAFRSLEYVTTDGTAFSPLFRDKYLSHLPVIMIHAVSAITALVIGPFQLFSRLRRFSPRAHRALGYAYFAAIFFGSITGFRMGLMAFGGLLPQIAFTLMALLWLITGWKGYRAIRLRRIEEHKNWMYRNFALTFGAVMLRVYLTLLQLAGFDFETIYPFVAWAAWLPNLLIVEFVFIGVPCQLRPARLNVKLTPAKPGTG
ncbi:DUF2306 domain-containing protein [Candidatus Sumerlaeota bacterium]|nr:DUF2306 domain-containing protein [Candidatus Sumerlaeota bacterium]